MLKLMEFTKGFKEIKFIRNISVNQKYYNDKLLVISLFQNLLDNAVKYKKESIAVKTIAQTVSSTHNDP